VHGRDRQREQGADKPHHDLRCGGPACGCPAWARPACHRLLGHRLLRHSRSFAPGDTVRRCPPSVDYGRERSGVQCQGGNRV